MPLELLKGNVAIAEAAVRVGLHAYFGYPITPQTELLEYLAERLPALERVFLQAESEVAAINMLYGAACTGVRCMTSSSGPGFSLMQEGLSYIAASEVPCVVVDVMRGGPGLGNILPSQGDYFQVTRSAGHGDYHSIVLAPASVQEAIDFTVLAFDLAEKYRHLVIIAADGLLGQMMEPAELPPMGTQAQPRPDWAIGGAEPHVKRSITSIKMTPEAAERFNQHLQDKLLQIRAVEQRATECFTEDAEFLVIGYGSAGRIAYTAVEAARRDGLRVGMFRPQTLYPFPEVRLAELAEQVKGCLVVEMNAGQMLEDVRLVLGNTLPIHFHGRMGGVVPMPDEIESVLRAVMQETLDQEKPDAEHQLTSR